MIEVFEIFLAISLVLDATLVILLMLVLEYCQEIKRETKQIKRKLYNLGLNEIILNQEGRIKK